MRLSSYIIVIITVVTLAHTGISKFVMNLPPHPTKHSHLPSITNYIFIQESTGLFKVNNPLKPYFSFIPPSLDEAALPNEEPVGAGWLRVHCDKM